MKQIINVSVQRYYGVDATGDLKHKDLSNKSCRVMFPNNIIMCGIVMMSLCGLKR
jgi:hypothetical protein